MDRKIVIVTGSTGNIGDAIMRRFGSRAEEAVGFDHHPPNSPVPNCTYIKVDVTSDKSVEDGMREVQERHGSHIASVVHLAAFYDFAGKPDPRYDSVTVEGTRRLLRGLNDGRLTVEQFIFSSTMLVHKPAEPGEFIDEDWPIEPTWPYPESKVKTEQVIREERGSIPAVFLRIAGVYNDDCNSIPIAHQMQRIYERQLNSHFYSGETAHGQAFVHRDDLVDAIERTVDRRASLPPVLPILIGEPETLSYDEIQHTLGRLIHGEDWETYMVPTPIAKVGAWIENQIPGEDPFIKPWMIDRASDTTLSTSARRARCWGGAEAYPSRHAAKMVERCLRIGSLVQTQRPVAAGEATRASHTLPVAVRRLLVSAICEGFCMLRAVRSHPSGWLTC